MLKIGTKLSQLRNQHGFTQEMIAEKVGMSQGNYSKLESDKYESPSGEILLNLAEIYGITVTELLENANNQHINLSKNKDNAINAFIVLQETKKQNEQLVEAFKETIASQKETIAAQKSHIERLLAEVERLKC